MSNFQGNAARAILTPTRSPRRTLRTSALGVIVVIAVGVLLRGFPIDAALVQGLNTLHVGALGTAADFAYLALEPVAAVAVSAVLACAVWAASRSLRAAAAFASVIALTWLPSALVKLVVARPRPDAGVLTHPFVSTQTDGSYPSGHTVFVAAVAMAFWFLWRDSRYRALVIVGGAVAMGLIGLAVIVDGLHYPSDVLASVVWSVTVAPTARWLVVDVVGRGLSRTAMKHRCRQPEVG